MTNDFKTCKEYFRAFGRVLTRVNPEFCSSATKHGEEIHKMIGYYDDLDWKLGRFYLLKTIIEVRCLAKKYAVNNVVIIPIPSVIAKPLTGPEPKANKINAAINVVMLASRTVILALEYPESNA